MQRAIDPEWSAERPKNAEKPLSSAASPGPSESCLERKIVITGSPQMPPKPDESRPAQGERNENNGLYFGPATDLTKCCFRKNSLAKTPIIAIFH